MELPRPFVVELGQHTYDLGVDFRVDGDFAVWYGPDHEHRFRLVGEPVESADSMDLPLEGYGTVTLRPVQIGDLWLTGGKPQLLADLKRAAEAVFSY